MNERPCPHCKTLNRPESRFCRGCGRPLDLPAPAEGASSPDTPTLVVHWPGGETREHVLTKPTVHVGRGPENDIVLDFSTVSHRHLKLEVTASEIRVTDLGSTNGTQLGGQRIQPNVAHPWLPGDAVRVGDLRGNSVSMDIRRGAGQVSQTRNLGMQMLAQYSRVLIGRDPASQLPLDHPTVSRRHAEIVRQNGGFAIRDLGSANGTFVNGQRISEWTLLRMNDLIQIGPFKLIYDMQAQGLSRALVRGHSLDAMELGMQVADNRMILEDISLSVQAGEFVSLVGGSGAGKSTLLKAMNGFNPATHGQMLIDGQDLYTNLDAYRTMMGYVPQDDIIHRDLPVHLALWYAAKLRLPDASEHEIERRIENVLDMVEMTAHADKPVKVLSGGQRKRVSIAAELLAEPALLFLDEPTSGLDPGLEKKMMYDLNRLSDQGKTVVLVTHATANIEQCDHVAFLVRGRLAYYGPPKEAISFFQAQDFADIYLKLSEEVNPADSKLAPPEVASYLPVAQARSASSSTPAGLLWAEHYSHSSLYHQYVTGRQPRAALPRRRPSGVPRKRRQRAHDSALRQLLLLARRQFDLIRHDMITLFVLLVMMPFIASLFMMVSNKDDLVGWQLTPEEIETQLEAELEGKEVDEKAEYMPAPTAELLVTMLGLALTQAGTFGAAFEIVKERSIFARERAVNLRVGAYIGSKVLVLGAFALIQVASSLLILGLKLDLDFEPVFEFFSAGAWELGLTLFLAVLASIMMGLFISAVVPNQNIVLYVILGQLFVQIILSGAMFPLPDNPVTKGISNLVVSRWTMDAMGSTVNIQELNEESRVCRVVEFEIPNADPKIEIACDSAALPQEDLGLEYEHSAEHLRLAWLALLLQAAAWCGATIAVQIFKKPE